MPDPLRTETLKAQIKSLLEVNTRLTAKAEAVMTGRVACPVLSCEETFALPRFQDLVSHLETSHEPSHEPHQALLDTGSWETCTDCGVQVQGFLLGHQKEEHPQLFNERLNLFRHQKETKTLALLTSHQQQTQIIRTAHLGDPLQQGTTTGADDETVPSSGSLENRDSHSDNKYARPQHQSEKHKLENSNEARRKRRKSDTEHASETRGQHIPTTPHGNGEVPVSVKSEALAAVEDDIRPTVFLRTNISSHFTLGFKNLGSYGLSDLH